MGFFSFLGRVLFASIFILSAWQMFNEFGDDGGPAAKELIPKVALVEKHLSSTSGIKLPTIDARHLATAALVQKGIGGILFVFGSALGAYLLLLHLALFTPLLYDFYNYSQEQPEYFALLNDFLLNFALFGALLYFIGMKNLIPKRQLKKKSPKAKAA